MHCEKAEMLLPLLVFDEIEDGEKVELMAHLSQCASCSEKLGDLRVTTNLLREGFAAAPLPVLAAERRAKLMRKLSKPPRRSKGGKKKHATSQGWPRRIFSFMTDRQFRPRFLYAAAGLAIAVGLTGLLLPSLGSARRSARQMQGNSQARGIHGGLVLESQGRNETYANSIGEIAEGNYFSPEYIISPNDTRGIKVPSDLQSWPKEKRAAWINENSSYAFVRPGEKSTNDASRVVLFEKPLPGQKGISVVFDDNHAQFVPMEEARDLIQSSTGKSLDEWNESFAFKSKLESAESRYRPADAAVTLGLVDESRSMRSDASESRLALLDARRSGAKADPAGPFANHGWSSGERDDKDGEGATNGSTTFSRSKGVAGGGGAANYRYSNQDPNVDFDSDQTVGPSKADRMADGPAVTSGSGRFNAPLPPPIVSSTPSESGLDSLALGAETKARFGSVRLADDSGILTPTTKEMEAARREEPSAERTHWHFDKPGDKAAQPVNPAKPGRPQAPAASAPATPAPGPAPVPAPVVTDGAPVPTDTPVLPKVPSPTSEPVPETAPSAKTTLAVRGTMATVDGFGIILPDLNAPVPPAAGPGIAGPGASDPQSGKASGGRVAGEQSRKIEEGRQAVDDLFSLALPGDGKPQAGTRIQGAEVTNNFGEPGVRSNMGVPAKNNTQLGEEGKFDSGRVLEELGKSDKGQGLAFENGKDLQQPGKKEDSSPAELFKRNKALDAKASELQSILESPRTATESSPTDGSKIGDIHRVERLSRLSDDEKSLEGLIADPQKNWADGGDNGAKGGKDLLDGMVKEKLAAGDRATQRDEVARLAKQIIELEAANNDQASASASLRRQLRLSLVDLPDSAEENKEGARGIRPLREAVAGEYILPSEDVDTRVEFSDFDRGDLQAGAERRTYSMDDFVPHVEGEDRSPLEIAQRAAKAREIALEVKRQLIATANARPNSLSITETNGVLVVRATPQEQESVTALIRNLRTQGHADKSAGIRPQNDASDDRGDLQPAASFRIMPVNPWTLTQEDAQSTFALDVDTASYTLGRRYIHRGFLPPAGSVRMEEYINAFDYNYVNNSDDVFRIHVDAAPAPFGPAGEVNTKLIKVGIKGKVIGRDGRKPANLVLVVDTSGSMARPDRLPLIQHSLELLVGELSEHDTVSLVTFGSDVLTLLAATPASNKAAILAAIRSLQANGPTNLLKGVQAGYQLAAQAHRSGAINRLIVCSDGIATLGETEADTILTYVENYRKQGISCTAVGFGAGAYDDDMMEKLANKGDGSYYFVDSKHEARKVFVDDLTATLQTIAKDAKIQVEFNPQRVRRYRLIGYENRAVADKDFRNDTIDAGEVGSGQSSTALYEVELIGDARTDLGTVYVRYRNTDTEKIEEISQRLTSGLIRDCSPKEDPRFFLAACAAEFAELLRNSEHATGGSLLKLQTVLEQLVPQLPLDEKAAELLDLVRKAQGLPRAP